MRPRFAILFAGLVACRIGGPSANPDEYVSFPDATSDGAPATTTAPPGDDGTSPPPGDDATPTTPDDADDGGDPGAPSDDASEAEGGCMSTVATCDPIHNTGCDPLHQCDVNALVTTAPTGICVFGSPVDGGACTASILSESCAPKSTCVDGGCRQLCFCDDDCPATQCCSDSSGTPGFTMCQPCP